MIEHKIYLAQDDMQEGDKVFLTVNGSGFPATLKVDGTGLTGQQARRMPLERQCYTFVGVSVRRGEAVVVNPWSDRNEIIACLQ